MGVGDMTRPITSIGQTDLSNAVECGAKRGVLNLLTVLIDGRLTTFKVDLNEPTKVIGEEESLFREQCP